MSIPPAFRLRTSALAGVAGALAIGALTSGALLPASRAQDASAAGADGAPRFAAIRVDTSPLGPELYPPTGERLRAIVAGELARRVTVTPDAPGAPALVVRVTRVNISPEAPRDAAPTATTGVLEDHMDGETLVVAPDGAVRQRFPVTVSVPAQPYQGEPGVEADFARLTRLAESYAAWSARFLGGK
ncbi:hypothetical protein ACFFJB_14530 [Camelimonas abortus]|uniref:Uncharacterized protein n=1 Tax=Camelimonas abortus TaxID=1017184 RepID=A0ABV7LF33_9HYPH